MFEVNYLAVLVTGVASMTIGALWYSPLMFGNVWMKLNGFTMADMEKAKAKGMTGSYIIAFAGALLGAYVLAHFLQVFGANSISEGLQVAFWAWLGFIVTTQVSGSLWEGKPWKLFLLNTASSLVTLLVASAILVSWV